ncbi:hypothetical protein ACFVWG_39085 [Kribbella sp. NPDC058245]|uniref:hypothetical protein n=1 Tax=Kribbella sp. NPDC058245 TaxID=3346399 RepID=UPI0036E78451
MTRQPPAERTLPDPERVLRRILSEHQPVRRRTGWLVPAIAAGAVAAIVTAALLVPPALRSGDQDVKPAATPSQSADIDIDIDLGPLSQAEIDAVLKRCWFWNGTMQKILHASKIRTGWGDEDWTLAMIGHGDGGNGVPPGDDRLTGCSGRPKGPAETTPSDTGFRLEPFFADVGPMRYDDSFRPDEGAQLNLTHGKVASSTWVKVPATVQRTRQRIVYDAAHTSPWFSSKAVDGLTYVQAWLDWNNSMDSRKVRLETQFLNAAGEPVRIPGSNGLTSTSSVWLGVRK